MLLSKVFIKMHDLIFNFVDIEMIFQEITQTNSGTNTKSITFAHEISILAQARETDLTYILSFFEGFQLTSLRRCEKWGWLTVASLLNQKHMQCIDLPLLTQFCSAYFTDFFNDAKISWGWWIIWKLYLFVIHQQSCFSVNIFQYSYMLIEFSPLCCL